MSASALNDTLVLGTLSGMRSMAGVTALAVRHGGLLGRVLPVLAAGELIADKTSFIGNRIDPIPLAGRAFMGAVAGALTARNTQRGMVLHGLIGAATAVIATHVAYRARKALPVSGLVGGLLEDSIVVSVAALYNSSSRRAQDA